MAMVILNGSSGAHDSVDALATRIEQHAEANGETVRHFILRESAVGHCLGDFDCWVRTPGRCRIPDAGQEIERAVHDADRVVLATPLLFGGMGPQLKKAVDRLIPLILPFFERAHDLTHHAHRYKRLPELLGVAVHGDVIGNEDLAATEAALAADAALFAGLIESQALNLGAPLWHATTLHGATAATAAIAPLLVATAAPGNASGDAAGATRMLRAMTTAEPHDRTWPQLPSVALLVASARPPGASTSLSIARYLADRMGAYHARPEIVMASEFARSPANADAAAERLASADVLVVIAPVYVDTLPFLAVQALQAAALARAGRPPGTLMRHGGLPQRVVGIINCGFPEPEHTRFAFGNLRAFTRQVGAHFAGGLALGGGEIVHGQDMVAAGGVATPWREALDAAAASLSLGGVLSADLCHATARPLMPPALYRLAGSMGWRFKGLGAGLWPAQLRARPFDVLSDAEWQADAKRGGLAGRPLRVVDKHPETSDSMTIWFEDPAESRLTWQAGQYLTLDVEIDGQRVRRAYSLASTPDDPGLAITVKRVPGGLMSNYLIDHLAVADIVRSHGPSGTFCPHPDDQRLLLIGGGSGIVPLVAIARHWLRHVPQAQIVLLYGAASRARAIHGDALQALAERHAPQFALHWVLEQGGPGAATGALDEAGAGALLDGVAPAGFDRILLCGPDAMRASVRAMLAARGVAAERLLEESFASPRAAIGSSAPQSIILISPGAPDREIIALPGQTVLDALLAAEAPISFSCLSGGCGACTITLDGGADQVVLDEPNQLGAAARAKGQLPACICRPIGPVRLQIGALVVA